jgi:heat-inducible transcriptional repressor
MVGKELDGRSKEILRAVISQFIATGAPIGSRTISKMARFGFSSATIRNIMADLEETGYLTQPYTSAGRIPTDRGYRFYVDSLMRSRTLRRKEKEFIIDSLKGYIGDIEHLVEQTTRILSHLSKNLGLVFCRRMPPITLKHIRFIKLDYPKILVVLVCRSSAIINKLIEVFENFDQSELDRISNYLMSEFNGLNLFEIRGRLLKMMKEEKAFYGRLLSRALTLSTKSFTDDLLAESLHYNGTSQLLEQPEFTDIKRMRAFFRAFEEKGRLIRLLNKCIEGGGIQIIIGSEAFSSEFSDYSLITCPYRSGENILGTLGVLGPRRMKYDKAIPLVEYVSRVFSEMITEYSR